MITRILLVQLRQLGDIILTTPCIREIRRLKKDAHITFLSHRMGKLVLEANPYIDEMFFYDEREGLAAQLRLMRTLRDKKFDVVIDFMNNPRSALFTFATAALERIAFKSSRRFAYTELVEKPKSEDYIVRRKFELLKPLGLSPSKEGLIVPWFENDAATTIKFIQEQPLLKQSALRVILSPTHRRPMRQWPLARYAALSDRLIQELGASVTWLWGPGEEHVADEGLKLCKLAACKAPPTSFREMAAFIANHDLFIGNSNGPSHVAVAADIHSIQLHGHTSAKSWCPMTPKHSAIQSPLQSSDPEHAMEGISVEEVWSMITSKQEALAAAAGIRKRLMYRVNWQQEWPR